MNTYWSEVTGVDVCMKELTEIADVTEGGTHSNYLALTGSVEEFAQTSFQCCSPTSSLTQHV